MSDKTANPWTVWRDWLLLLAALGITYLAASLYWSASASLALTNARSALHGTHWIEPNQTATQPTTHPDATSLLLQIRDRFQDQPRPFTSYEDFAYLDGLLPLPPKWVATAQKNLAANAHLIHLAQQAAAAGPLHLDRTPVSDAHPDDTPVWSLRIGLSSSIELLTQAAILHADEPSTALAHLTTAYQLIGKLRAHPAANLREKDFSGRVETDIHDATHYVASQLKLPPDPTTSRATRQLALALIANRLAAVNRPPLIGSYPDLLGYQSSLSDSLTGPLLPLKNSIMAALYTELRHLDSATPERYQTTLPLNSSIPLGVVDDFFAQLTHRMRSPGYMDQCQIFDLRAALALAVSLYHADTGRYPSTLDELVPTYLPKIPTDPESNPPTKVQYFLIGNRPLISLGAGQVSKPTTLPSNYLGTIQIEPMIYYDLLLLPRPLTTPSPPP